MAFTSIYELKNKAPLIVDYSHWQGRVNTQKLKKMGVVAAIVKAGEVWMRTAGKPATEDKQHAWNIEQIKEAGLISGDYYFWHPKAEASKQATHYFQISGKNRTELPPIIDVEAFDGYTYKDKVEVGRLLHGMVRAVEDLFGRKPIIYTTNGLWVNQVGNPDWGKDYLFWLAKYSTTMDFPDPKIRENVVLWQFTDRIALPGLPTMDGNYWLKSEQKLYELASEEGREVDPIVWMPIEIWRIRRGLYPLSKKNREWLDKQFGRLLPK